MESKKNDIAILLAKKEIGFNDTEDKANQDKLQKLFLKQDQVAEEINLFMNKAIAIITEANPGVQMTPELELGILLSLQKQIEEGGINTMEQVNSNSEVLVRITNEITSSDKYYVPDSVNYEQNADEVAAGTIAGIAMAEFMGKDMTQEEILKFEEEYKNSDEYKQAVTSSMDNLFNAKTEDEKQKAASEMAVRDTGSRSRDYRIQNKGTKADRATLMIIARKAASGNPELAKEAAIEAKMFGYEHLVGENGEFNLEKVHGAFLESLGDDKLKEQWSDFGTFMEKVQAANERGSRRAQKEYEKFREEYSSKSTTEDKMEAMKQREQREARKQQVIKELAVAVEEKNTDQIGALMQEFAALDMDSAKTVLLNIASQDKTSVTVRGQIIDFANERFAEEKSIENKEPNVPTAPNVDDGWDR